jgi:glycosyltransferase involved in cell wall biosynthesis
MAETKQIAFLCHPYHRGGVTRWMADAAADYAKKGHKVYFLTLEPAHTFFSGEGRETMLELVAKASAHVHIISIKVGREFEFGTPGYCTYVYQRLLLNLRPGIPVILSDDSMVWDAAAKLHKSYPIVGVLHADEDYYYNIGKKYFHQLSALACVSKRVSRRILEVLGTHDSSKVYTIPCGINLPAAKEAQRSNNILQLIYVGRITNYQKRVGDLLKIAAMLIKHRVAFHINIVGDGGADKIALEQKVTEEGLADYITFCGWLSQTDVADMLNRSDMLVMTSDFEGTPIAMMEAVASGCGIVGTRVSGIEDYEDDIDAPNCFRVFETGDIESAVAHIISLSQIPVAVRRAAARSMAERNFSMDVCLQKYSKVVACIPSQTYTKSFADLPLSKNIYSRLISTARYLKMRLKK